MELTKGERNALNIKMAQVQMQFRDELHKRKQAKEEKLKNKQKNKSERVFKNHMSRTSVKMGLHEVMEMVNNHKLVNTYKEQVKNLDPSCTAAEALTNTLHLNTEFQGLKNMARNMLGREQHFAINIGMASANVDASIGGIISTTYLVELSNFIEFSSWAVVFDEYRIKHVKFHYRPRAQGTYDSSVTVGQIPMNLVAYVDYDDQTALGNFDAGWSHDNCVATCTNQPLETEFLMQGGPDDNWIITSTANTVVATLKMFAVTGGSISVNYGKLFNRGIVQFRMVQ